MSIKVDKKVSVMLTGGGTGGHIFPLLAVGDWLREIGEGEIEVSYVGSAGRFREEFEERYMRHYSVLPSKLRRYFSLKNLLDVPIFFVSLLQALFWVLMVMPDIVFSKGGPGALAVILAARFYRIPVVVHESDAVPSLTNRMSARFAERVGISFDSTASFFPKSHVFFSGNPIREELMKDWVDQFSAKSYFKLDPSEPVLFVLGGSQGALRLNDFVLDNLQMLLGKVQIIHQVGSRNFKSAGKLSEISLRGGGAGSDARYKLKEYLNAKEMKIAYNAADIVVSRSGSSIHEMALFGKPMILVPLGESANRHQQANAYEFGGKGAALVVEEENLKPNVFLNEVEKLLDPKASQAMSQAAQSLARRDAVEMIGKEILSLVGVSV